ncbi:MAG: Cupin domain protein [Paenibacillus sp.]|jgi:mannose-6-phosphate isomerase-like protein (cupin superfamily)|nr:Cupin domain protein [Paenibacillus sp.]
MGAKPNYAIAKFHEIDAVPCPCGYSKRAFMDDPDRIASLHEVQIKRDSETHYHKKLTEIYYILEGQGHMELDGAVVPVEPGMSIMIKPGCRHRAVGDLKIINVALPTFDPEDEWFD